MAQGPVVVSGASLDDVAELLRENFETPFTELMDRSIFLFQRIKRKTGTGKQVAWKAHIGGNTSVGSYAEEATIPDAGKQSYTQASVPFTRNWVTIEVSGFAQAATRGSGGYMEELAQETAQGLEDLKNEINGQMLANAKDEATDIDGLGYLIEDTGTYAGISRTLPYWKPFVLRGAVPGTPEPLTIGKMQAVRTEMRKPLRKAKTSAILTGTQQFYNYGNLLEDQRRWVNTDKLDAGFTALQFENLPVIDVEYMPDGLMYFLDESELQYYVLENFATKPKSTNKDSDRFIVTHYSQFVMKRPNAQAKITDLS